MNLATIIPALLAVVLVISRYLTALRPLWSLIPAKLQWIAPAVLGSCAMLAAALPKLAPNDTVGLVEVIITCVVVPLVLAFTAGARAPDPVNPEPPVAQKPGSIVSIVFLAFMITGCAGSFEEAKLANPSYLRGYAAAATPSSPSQACLDLDSQRRTWSAIAAGAGILTGAGGLATIPADDQAARIGIAAGAVVAAVLSGVALAEVNGIGSTWVSECSQPGNEVAK